MKSIDEIISMAAPYLFENKQTIDEHAQVVETSEIAIPTEHPFYWNGWRPAVGWIGVLSFGYAFVFVPVFGAVTGITLPLPAIAYYSVLTTLVLGIGVMRTVERVKGTLPK